MFQLQTDKWGLVEVSFLHANPDKTIKKATPGTLCMIGTDKDNLSTGRSFLSIHDQYCKEIGRKISLARALEALEANKAQRTRFWQEYHYTRQRDQIKASLTVMKGNI